MPAVQDIRGALPDARIDWVVERGFAPLVARCEGVDRVIASDLRRWRNEPFAAQTRSEWRAFRARLRGECYDAVVDLQGLTKSALVSRMVRLASGGKRYALANQTEGAGYEAPTRWLADVAIRVEPHIHAVQRSRELCARAFGYKVPVSLEYGLQASAGWTFHAIKTVANGEIALVHGSSRDDKCWPEPHWIELGRRLIAQGHILGLPHGSDDERERSERLARALGVQASVWPRLDLDVLTDRLAACAGVIGVDSGLSHVAVALGLPHVQIYNFDTAWRTGPPDCARQQSVFAHPAPSIDLVWNAWQQVRAVV